MMGLGQDNERLQPVPNEATDSIEQEKLDDLADEKNGLKSLLLPGWGQVVNKQYVKAAGFAGAVATGIVLERKANKDYKPFAEAYSSRLQHFDDPIDQFKDEYDLNDLYDLRQKELSKRDLIRGATTYVYLINAFDAAVQYKLLREDPKEHSPTRAAYYSLILPGLGQAYNKKYWKIPIFYGALGTSLYFANYNRDLHRKYQKELEFRSVGETSGFRQVLNEDRLKDNLEYWRKWRDFSYIATVVVYGLNVVDATVDAQLYDFNVDDDLSFVQPAPQLGLINGQPYYALQLTHTINYK